VHERFEQLLSQDTRQSRAWQQHTIERNRSRHQGQNHGDDARRPFAPAGTVSEQTATAPSLRADSDRLTDQLGSHDFRGARGSAIRVPVIPFFSTECGLPGLVQDCCKSYQPVHAVLFPTAVCADWRDAMFSSGTPARKMPHALVSPGATSTPPTRGPPQRTTDRQAAQRLRRLHCGRAGAWGGRGPAPPCHLRLQQRVVRGSHRDVTVMTGLAARPSGAPRLLTRNG